MIPFLRTVELALREIRANRLRSILMILCVAAAVATTTIVNQMAASAEQDISDTIARTQGVRGTIEATVSDLSLADQMQVLSPHLHDFADGRAIDLGTVNFPDSGDDRALAWPVHAMDPEILGTFPNGLLAGRWLKLADAAHPVVPVVISARVADEIVAGLSEGSGGRADAVGRVLTFDFPLPVLVQVVGVLDQGVLSHKWDGVIVPLDEDGFPVAMREWVYRTENTGGAVRLYSSDPTAPEKLVSLVNMKVTAAVESRGLVSQSVQVMRVDNAEEFEQATKTLNMIMTSIGAAVLLIGVTAVAIVSMMSLRAGR